MSFIKVPFDKQVVDEVVAQSGISVGTGSIREVNRVVNEIEARLGVRFIRMEFGVPGLPADPIAIEAEIAALRDPGVASTYAPFDGLPVLKEAASEFVKAFLDLDVPPQCCIPTHGAMHGGYVAMGVAGRRFAERDTILFLDPGFPVSKLQCRIWGLANESLDFYDLRGDALIAAVEERLATGRVAALMYNTPNNPTWVVFDDSELAGLGRLCSEHDVVAIEDLAYFGMDFRQEYGIPGEPPYPPTIAQHTDRYVLLLSGSKSFSYAGQRVAVAIVAPGLYATRSSALKSLFGTERFGNSFVQGGIYPTTACVAASVQHGLAALFRASVAGEIDFTSPLREYGRRAHEMKKAFLENGFELVYDNDLGEPLADGFYFTLKYGRLHCTQLLEELVYYGISAIGLNTTGSTRDEGIRACVSRTDLAAIPELRHRLEAFRRDHPVA